MDSKNNLIKIIDILHSCAHNGAFDNMDEDIIDSISDFLRIFLDVKVTTEQACKILGKPPHTIKNIVNRKLKKENRYKSYWLIKLKSIIDCIK